MPVCPYCNEEKNNRGFAIHKIHCSENPKNKSGGNHSESEESQNQESKYTCGKCGGDFNNLHKYCPHCGVELE